MVIITVSFSQCSQIQTTFYHHRRRHLETRTVRFVLRPALTLPKDWPKGQISAVMYGQTDKPTVGQSQAHFQNEHRVASTMRRRFYVAFNTYI